MANKKFENLREIYNILCEYGFERVVSIDLGMLQSIDYYTGSIFKCYTHGVGFPICAGGRYDKLMGKFGRDAGAVGVAMGVNRIISALRNSKKTIGHAEPSASLLYAEKGAEGVCYDLAVSLRINGCLVEQYIGDGEHLAAEEYAHTAGMGSMLRVFKSGKLQIKDLGRGQITETTVNDFIGYYDDDDCGLGHEHDHDCDCGHEHHHDCNCGHEHHCHD